MEVDDVTLFSTKGNGGGVGGGRGIARNEMKPRGASTEVRTFLADEAGESVTVPL